MSFRLHTHFCVNNSLSFPKSFRKQARKSAEVWAERTALGSLRRAPAWHQQPQSPWESQEGRGGPGDTFSTIKGFLETPTFDEGRTSPLLNKRGLWCQTRSLTPSPSGTEISTSTPSIPKATHSLLKYAHCVSDSSFSLPPTGNYF